MVGKQFHHPAIPGNLMLARHVGQDVILQRVVNPRSLLYYGFSGGAFNSVQCMPAAR